jgi:hypothetical protein
MSSDTGIYVAEFPEGFRVTKVVGNIDNIDFFPVGSKGRKKELKAFFGKSEVYPTLDEALKKSQEILNEWDDYTEYGICFIGKYERF